MGIARHFLVDSNHAFRYPRESIDWFGVMIMKTNTVTALVSISLFLPSAPVYSSEVVNQNVRSYCRVSSKRTMDELRTLNEWIHSTESKLAAEKSKREQNLFRKHPVKCGFLLLTDGSLSNLHVIKSSGSKKADLIALNLVSKCAPFEPCLHSLARRNGFTVEFGETIPKIAISKESHLTRDQKVIYPPIFSQN